MMLQSAASYIAFKGGYKYQLAEDFTVQTDIKPATDINTFFISLTRTGILTIRRGYAWDGPSGPTFDTNNFMRGSVVHDSFYQLMRAKLLPDYFKIAVDRLLQAMCIEDGMWTIRAWWVYVGVSTFGKGSTLPKNAKKIVYAPIPHAPMKDDIAERRTVKEELEEMEGDDNG